MPSSPPPPPAAAAGTGQEEVEMASGEAFLPHMHAAETGAGEERGGPSAPEVDEADGSDDGEEGDSLDEDGGASADNATDDGEGEEDEEAYTEYSFGPSQESDEEQLSSDSEGWENLQENAEKGGDGMEHSKPAVASCCVCMEPWTSDGAHRLCCIPCGHVYGRSCLEKWLRRCGGTKAKCPQCGESFEREKIINIYGTEYLWNDCIHDEEALLAESAAMHERLEAAAEVRLEAALAVDRRVMRETLEAALEAALASMEEKFRSVMDEKFREALVAQNAIWHQTFSAHFVAQGLPPPPMPALPPLGCPDTHDPSGARSNEHEPSHTSPHDNPLDSSPPS